MGNNTRGRVRICKSYYNTYVLTMYGYNENKKGDNNSRYFVAFFPIHLSSEHPCYYKLLHPAFLHFYTHYIAPSYFSTRYPSPSRCYDRDS